MKILLDEAVSFSKPFGVDLREAFSTLEDEASAGGTACLSFLEFCSSANRTRFKFLLVDMLLKRTGVVAGRKVREGKEKTF